jgi:LysB family phage lysis regulatory protein
MKAIAAALIILLVGLLLVGIQQYRIVAVRGEMLIETQAKDKAVAANLESQATITTLQGEVQRNKDYVADLSKRIKVSEDKAEKARKDFAKLKRDSKPVRDWAAQPLPDGLRGKAAGGNKDNGNKAGSP